ncbi:glycoside hydrolase family 76 protein [Nocardia crassostreae]|uniref:glycoside hydrolase family 76 protein n=1 Tax=Nocardia crassostreae TaxID=53428 RepID=UPI0009FF48DF|nr:glycoside hydrolase family 76 protein [Nocardia crassostreae]
MSRRRFLLATGVGLPLTVLAAPTDAGSITLNPPPGPADPGERADLTERAILARHVRPLWGMRAARLGAIRWPYSMVDLSFAQWDYWWQAHLLDCAVDAAHRARTPERLDRVTALAQSIRTRNLTGWTNRYYDDMGWLAVAVERTGRLLDIRFGYAADTLRTALLDGWNPSVGAVPWRIGSDYYNTPAIGPTAIALARTGELPRARELAEFLHTRLRVPDTGLILDGIHEPGGRRDTTILTYCQGVTIGLETELAARTGTSAHHDRAAALIAATAAELCIDGVIPGAGESDSGLFMGICARYLAEAALTLGDTTAAHLVHASARAAWHHRAEVDGLPLFGTDWTRPITHPNHLPHDLSVQLSGWMLLEADHRLTAAGY